MAKYMLILGGADLDKRSDGRPGDANRGPMLERYLAWVKTLSDGGHLVGSYKLYDQTGARLTVRGGEVVDGPFVETKEAIGGIFVIEAASLEQATALSRDCPVLRWQNGWVEVRAVER
jgi:hypothetical protein